MTERLVHQIATWVAGVQLDRVPGEARAVAKSCLVDVLGVGLAARNRRLARQAADYTRAAHGEGASTILATILGDAGRGDPAGAAFANGIAAHLLDFDDTCYAGMVHGSAVVFPAVLAAAEATGASGSDLLAAFIAGVETTYALESALGPGHYHKGWFATGSLGAIGAAAGAARLFGNDAEGIARAIALATAQTGGLRVVLGTDAKPYCAGRAAQAGLEAARFARSATTFPPDVFTGRNGFFALFGEGAVDPDRIATPGDPFCLLEPGIFFKRYPLCSSAQAALEAFEDLLERHAIETSAITKVTCALAPFAASCLPYRRPQTVTEAQFSLPFAIACRLVHGRMTADLLSDATLADPKLAAAMEKVVLGANLVDQDTDAYPEAARVTIDLADGRSLSATCLTARGDPRTPMTEAELDAKFMAASTGSDTGLSRRVAESCLARVKDLEALPAATELLAPLRGL